MIDLQLLSKSLCAYLQNHFQAVEVRQSQRTHKDDGCAFLIHADHEDYTVIVMDDAFSPEAGSEEIQQGFERYKLASVMCDLTGFAVTVSESGCIFEN